MIQDLLDGCDAELVAKQQLQNLQLHRRLASAELAVAVSLMGSHLRGVRISAGYTQQALAKEARVQQAYISRLEHGSVQGISVDALRRVLEAYRRLEDGLSTSGELRQAGGG